MDTLVRIIGALFVVTAVGCTLDPFCIQCSDADPQSEDAAPDSCVPGSPELCNGRDDNCDGFIDEGFAFESDPFNCGGCGIECELPYALPACVDRQCVIDLCLPGAVDFDGDPANGCEMACTIVETVTSDHCDGEDCCDGADNDCDGEIGEDHDTSADPNNCGGCASACESFPCPHICWAPFASTECVDGSCVMTSCETGYFDRDGDMSNGCEVHCEPSGDETCDGIDNDCNGEVDESFENQGLPCGDASCNAGTLECVSGEIECVREFTETEICDGEDNDCDDSTVDGSADPELGQPCGATGSDGCPNGTTVCTAGALTCDEGADPRGATCGTTVGACETGVWACVDGAYACEGETAAVAEVCGDGIDNDCDGDVDDRDDDLNIGGFCDNGTGTGGVGICVFGTLTCESGEVVCDGFAPPTDEVCNGLDADCNGFIDDNLPLMSSCDEGHTDIFGNFLCRSGEGQCVGFLPLRPEICDGFDNDDDGETDEDAVCPGDGECDRLNGMCTIACRDVDQAFLCPPGMNCANGQCVGHLCTETECGECEQCDPSTGHCIDRCAGLACGNGLVCHCGRCWPPTCGALGCPDGEMCSDGGCVSDPCATTECGDDQACADGVCFDVCAYQQCVATERCVRGECVDDPCSAVSCPTGTCDSETGECSTACSGEDCPPGEACELATGRCIQDSCLAVHCPDETFCVNGSCFEPPPVRPDGGPDADVGPDGDAGPDLHVFATGGGGCFCRSGAGASRGALPVAFLVLIFGFACVALRRIGR